MGANVSHRLHRTMGKEADKEHVMEDLYRLHVDEIWTPRTPINHRNEDYDQEGFEVLVRMQKEHFWYRGRHRFLLAAVCRTLNVSRGTGRQYLSAVDLGGGCGGWISYLSQKYGACFKELALADSSMKALQLAGSVLPKGTSRYQVDLVNLHWQDRWDVVFLLDVLEHISEDERAMSEICKALKPGGLLFLTSPALEWFRTWNDEAAHHHRRYARKDLERLANKSRLELLYSRYFMFFLSPLLWLSRLKGPPLDSMSQSEISALLARTHRVPGPTVNGICTALFAAETPLGFLCPFPWGTSILGVFRK